MKSRKDFEDSILKYFELNKKRKYKFNNLCKNFDLDEKEEECFNDALIKLQEQAKIILNDAEEYTLFKDNENLYVGKLVISKKGKNEGQYYISTTKGNIYISSTNLLNAMPGDIVLLEKSPYRTKGLKIGKIKRVITRTSTKIIANCILKNGILRLIPMGCNLSFEIALPRDVISSLVDGDRIAIEIEEDNSCKYLYKICHKDDPNAYIKIMAFKEGIDINYPKEVMDEVKKIPQILSEKDYEGRLDLRSKLIFTIDGKDTKDMDDAVSLEINQSGNYVLGVHIADVSNYITPDMETFKDALKRGNSFYPANFVIPMLSHEISNGICSLNPCSDRLTISCFMEFDTTGKLVNYDIKKSVINSYKKMSYEDVNMLLENNKMVKGYELFADNLRLMQEFDKILDNKKQARGFISFGDHDIKTEFDEKGQVISITQNKRGTSEKIIEDFMLQANECVATHMKYLGEPFNYRVHDKPREDQINEVIEQFNTMGIKIKVPNNLSDNYSMQGLMRQISNLEVYPILSEMLLQSVPRAYYSTNNIGHFGLALRNYTHFTSPIRRASDLVTHVLLKHNISCDFEEKYDDIIDNLDEICMNCSKQQKVADNFERKVNLECSLSYMDNHKSDSFFVTVFSIGTDKISVRTTNGICGHIYLNDLCDKYNFKPSKMCLVNKDKEIHLGSKLNVSVKNVDKSNKKIFFEELKIKSMVRKLV